ncbi:DegT/DnrJ/EryC1/StrS family aminotransferase [Desulfococcus sp.]|uniref:DegT/DnrJ/EryC1/StrS family aminotransferase n=1 Tax=Desulfococcus sp. TaxID=2025834 RepID=UPI0035946517
MDFIDLKTQQIRIRSRIEKNIQAVLDHGQYIMGPEILKLESRLAEFAGVKHAVSCASGTDALLMTLMAYDIGPGDAVFTTPFTFVATAEAIRLLGATPVFVDIDPVTFNIDPKRLREALLAHAQTETGLAARGILPVDLFGLPADYDAIRAVAREHGLFVLEDAAQSFGAEYRGRKAGALGDAAATSFFPAKPLGAYGDGGMCFTDDDALAAALRSVRIHGMGADKYDNVRIGINGRMDTIQAAVLLAKLDIFPEEVQLRQTVAGRYTRTLAGVVTPTVPEGLLSAWAQYSVLAEDARHREALQARLKAAGIPTAVYYPIPLHLQTAYTSLGGKPGDFPVTEDCANRIFSLPMHPYLSAEDQERIAAVFLGRS